MQDLRLPVSEVLSRDLGHDVNLNIYEEYTRFTEDPGGVTIVAWGLTSLQFTNCLRAA